ncbi:hypothetical protein GCM10027168_32260 [Streptomyces capparidis]
MPGPRQPAPRRPAPGRERGRDGEPTGDAAGRAGAGGGNGRDPGRGGREPGPGRARRRLTGREAAVCAAVHVREFTGREPEAVVALERTGDGWRVGIEVLEARRVPDTTDVLALYRVDVDEDGELIAYRRDRRYSRGRGEEGER